jgi:hypothetical protein
MSETQQMLQRDRAMVALLAQRDGPIPDRTLAHSAFGECRYRELYRDGRCPWCEAEARRVSQPEASQN